MTSVQFIAYQLKTAAEGNTNRQRYPGLNDQKSDIEYRCKIMADAIVATAKDPNINTMATKIFVAPEFFYRGGTGGVYDAENVSYVNETMDAYLADAKYARWIFVLGSTLAAMPGGGNEPEIMNICIVRKGGTKIVKSKKEVLTTDRFTPDDTRLIYKEYVSAVDFFGPYFGISSDFHSNAATAGTANVQGAQKRLRPTSGARPSIYVSHQETPNLHGDNHNWKPSVKFRAYILEKFNKGLITQQERDRLFNMNVNYTTSEQSPTGLGGGTNFSMGGLSFVLEICLDHVQRRAKATVAANTVDIHLVTSCGMSEVYKHVKPGGCFFLVDGMEHHPDRVSLQHNKIGTGWATINVKATIPMTQPSRWTHHMGNGKNLFQAGKGTVYVFPNLSIP